LSLKLVDSAGEENCPAIAVMLSWELSRLGLATLDGGGEVLLGDEGRLNGMAGLRGRKEMIDDVVRPDGEGGVSVVDSF
jgi:hypothetical protein